VEQQIGEENKSYQMQKKHTAAFEFLNIPATEIIFKED
jgi:hypothetical protein